MKKVYGKAEVQTYALKGVSFEIKEGEFVAIMGPSGSGKSTLLHQLGLLDQPTSGHYSIDSIDVLNLSEYQKSLFRLKHLGYVFQEFALLGELTVVENVALPLYMTGMAKRTALEKAEKILKNLGLADKLNAYPSHISGGQQQRVAIARSLAGEPKILFADEPCANLDTENSVQILELFKKLNKELNQTIVMVTHEEWHVNYVSRLIKLQDGLIVSNKPVRTRIKL